MLIRNVAADDYNDVFALLKQLFPGQTLDKNAQKESFGNTLSSNGEFGFCAVSDGKVTGYCAFSIMNNYLYNGYVFYITVLVVDENFRRQGIGNKLIDKVKQFAAEKGVKAIELDCGFHREDAHAFYERLGFVKECYFFSAEI